jgi:peptidoglycan-N-acetylglucosamine deacetylase
VGLAEPSSSLSMSPRAAASIGVASGGAAAALALPLLALPRSPAAGDVVVAGAAVVLAAAIAAWLRRGVAGGRWPAVLGPAAVALAGWLLLQVAAGAVVVPIAVAAGLGAGVSAGRAGRRWAAAGLGLVLAAAVVVDAGPGRRLAIVTATALAAVAAAAAAVLRSARPAPPARTPPLTRVGVAVLTLVALLVAAWVGANSTTSGWFGAMVDHGPRDRRQVALTFDDGPNVPATLAISHILDRAGVQAAFFTVGKALDRRPDVSAALLADGQLLGNHSYHHDETRWLDPRYLELARTQRAFARRLHVCPSLFRPPHGQHTPFMALVVHRHHMRMVGWDVSVGDWKAHDPAAVAAAVLRRVRPGSIVDLHDGLDGDVVADRSVVVKALPAILAGLRARHYRIVRLDRMLGVAPYAGRC